MSDTAAVNQNSGAHPPRWKWNALFFVIEQRKLFIPFDMLNEISFFLG
ncbi:hypothetical protein [Pectobacterium aquaticum]|nr:hypothetical protein [Pectobacterium aquaticum]MCH5052209.1 hypothetical protein [Pectobacterium aquaticum]